MRAWLLDAQEGIEKLRLGDAVAPSPGAGEVVLRMKLAALNPADRYLAEKQYPARPVFPHILGRDGLGTVERIGEGVSGIREGEMRVILRSEVGVSRPGTLAEWVSVPAASLAAPPAGWSEEESAGAALVYLTAYQALGQWGELQAGSAVLITGASGGVGVASVQLAKAKGCVVVGLSRSGEKAKRLKGLGADHVVNPEDLDWPERVKIYLGKRRVDVAVDNIGGALFEGVVGLMGDGGRISVVGRLGGVVPEFNTASLLFRRLRIGGVAVGAYLPEESQLAWREIVQMMSRTGARPVVDSVYPMERVPEAFARLKEGPMGKVVVRISA